MYIYEILDTVIMGIVVLMENWMLYRRWFRFDDRTGMGIIVLALFLEEGMFYAMGLERMGAVIVHYIFVVINLLPFQGKKLTRLLVVQMLYIFLFNVIGPISMVTCTTVYGFFTGASNETWMARIISTPVDYIFRYILLIPVGYVSCYLARKAIPLIEKLTEKERILLVLGTAVPFYAYYAFKKLAIESAADYYGGIVVILYGLFMADVGLCLVLFIVTAMIRVRAERKEMQFRMELQREQYEEIRGLQQGVRELRHDIVNHLAAGTLSEEGVRKLVETCRKAVKETRKHDG